MTIFNPSAWSSAMASAVVDFDRVGDGEDARRLAVDGDEHRGLAFFLKLARPSASSGSRPAIFSFRRKSGLPIITARPATVPTTPPAVTERKSFTASRAMLLLLRAPHDRGGQRMFAALLQRGGEPQELLRVETVGRQHIHELGFALGERAGLVHDERGDFLQPFERLGVLHEHALLRAASDADHDGHRRGQAERARAGDDEHRDGVDDGVREPRLRPEPQPDDEGEHRNRQHRRHEDRRDLVGEPLNGRAAALGFGHHVHDLPEQRVAADALGAHDETAGAVDGAAGHLVADGLFHRERFAGDHGFLDAGVAFDDHAIDGHLVAGHHAQLVADLHLVERDFLIAASARRGAPSAVRD